MNHWCRKTTDEFHSQVNMLTQITESIEIEKEQKKKKETSYEAV